MFLFFDILTISPILIIKQSTDIGSSKEVNYQDPKVWILIINFFTRANICVWFYINRFHLIDLWYVLLNLLTILSTLSIYIFFDIEVYTYKFNFLMF